MFRFMTSVLVVALFFSFPISVRAQQSVSLEECLKCHGDLVSGENFRESVHGDLTCLSCHREVDLSSHPLEQKTFQPVQCAGCHKERSAEHYKSVHVEEGVVCHDCHTRIHSRKKWQGDKKQVVQTCGECHDTDWYEASVHGQAIAQGNSDSAACHDCHNLHRIERLGEGTEGFEEFQIEVCMQCHADREMMTRNEVLPLTVASYKKSYHGKSYRLGYPQQVAVCADCHRAEGTAHGILPESHGRSSINSTNIVDTCGQCHAGIDYDFTGFRVHGVWHEPSRYPLMFWTFVPMTTLVVGVFIVFWAHTLLWMFRGTIEKREKENALAEGRIKPVPEGHVHYRRFRGIHIFLHLTVIVSFLGLSFTGLPLKFAGMPWADAMMGFYGGPDVAGLIHRICAVLTFFYFFVAVAMSIHFLFIRRDLEGGWLRRLIGPDSLMFNLKDVRDILGMLRWFVFRGEKPRFERWSYWEKFDFFAVFWGMFAIGGSGLILWFAEFFGSAIGGWILNVASIIHSDEALLATGFIFTVHFFNTHGRPEKFPMDFVIFNGEVSKEDFVEERPAHWERLQEKGTLEDYRVHRSSSVMYDFLFKAFGYLAVATGLFLAFLMLYAFIRGS